MPACTLNVRRTTLKRGRSGGVLHLDDRSVEHRRGSITSESISWRRDARWLTLSDGSHDEAEERNASRPPRRGASRGVSRSARDEREPPGLGDRRSCEPHHRARGRAPQRDGRYRATLGARFGHVRGVLDEPPEYVRAAQGRDRVRNRCPEDQTASAEQVTSRSRRSRLVTSGWPVSTWSVSFAGRLWRASSGPSPRARPGSESVSFAAI